MGKATQLNVIQKENKILEALNYCLDVPCSIQWGLLWFFSPSRLTNYGTQIAKYHEAVNMAIEIAFTMIFEGVHSPRTCLLTTVGVVLYKSPEIGTLKKRDGHSEISCLLPHDR